VPEKQDRAGKQTNPLGVIKNRPEMGDFLFENYCLTN